MKNKYFYHVFGLTVESEIQFSELPYGKDISDIKICIGDVPDKIDHEHIYKGLNFKFSNRNEFWLYIKCVAHFYIQNGEKIIVEPLDAADMGVVKSYLFSVVFGIVLLQRKLSALHGSSIVVNNKCLVFTGASGTGKSTICNLLTNKGFQFLADDISVLYMNEKGIPMVQPAYPHQRLCGDIATNFQSSTDRLQTSIENDGKILYYIPDSFINKPIPLAAIIELSPKHECVVSIKELTGTEKLKSFIENIFCFAFLQQAGINQKLFMDAFNIVKDIPYYRLERPIGKYTQEQQIDLVMEIIHD